MKKMWFIGFVLIVGWILSSIAYANTTLKDYYAQVPMHSAQTQFDPAVPTPESVLGFQVGEWHLRPELIAEYMRALATTSKRVEVEIMGRTYEHRPLMLVKISNENNIQKIDEIQSKHQAVVSLKSKQDDAIPSIVWMGYSVHGNEASGANASVLLAYYLAAAQSETMDKFLSQTIVLIDPMLNPDGLARFASWVNTFKGQQPVASSLDIEHNEAWPMGRTNHYWFDLNRDWLLLQHPESQARIKQFHQWKPQVLTDFHEMGPDSTYFFQPGVPDRTNPLTPEKNFSLTQTIANYHGKALDNIGSLYYTKESFDDFYYGKGSTYPDINGAIGILFEQASARGHLQQGEFGAISFPFAIKNQLTASFSTLEAVYENKTLLQNYQREFYQSALNEAKKFKTKAFVFNAGKDKTRVSAFIDVLQQHNIKVRGLKKDLKIDKRTFSAENSFVVELEQLQFKLIKTLFESQTEFKNNTFYDVSSWNLARAFNLNYASLSSRDYSQSDLVDTGVTYSDLSTNEATPVQVPISAIAIAIDWRESSSAVLANRLQKQGLRLMAATKMANFATEKGQASFQPGTVILTLNGQSMARTDVIKVFQQASKHLNSKFDFITSGMALSGIDLGSPSMNVLTLPKPILVVGEGVSSYEAGELWHLLDYRLEMTTTKVTKTQLEKMDLDGFTHLIMASGNYAFSDELNSKIADWINAGGQLIANRTAGRWLAKQDWKFIEKVEDEKQEIEPMSYAEREDHLAQKFIGGAIFSIELDLSHPLNFGLENKTMPVFHRGTDRYSIVNQPFATLATYSKRPLLSGYASAENQQKFAELPAAMAIRKGQGSVIYFTDNLNFRGYWYGTSKWFTNSLFFGKSFQSSF